MDSALHFVNLDYQVILVGSISSIRILDLRCKLPVVGNIILIPLTYQEGECGRVHDLFFEISLDFLRLFHPGKLYQGEHH
jgi:hypothetical protein